jgi:SEFIR domain
VFVSYVHESEQHQNDVLAFATFLRGQGVDAVLDLWSADARHDWYAWAIREMTTAAYVIVVASPTYRAVGDGSGPADRHRGVQSEATLLRDLVYGDRETWTPKVLPVLLPGHGIEEIPHFLSPYTTSRFTVEAHTVDGAEGLLRVIHRSPGHVPPPVLAPPDLPPRPAPAAVVWCADIPVDIGPDAVEVHLVPAEPMDLQGFEGGTSLAVLPTGQRSAWFPPVNDLVAALERNIGLLMEIDLPRPTAWLPAIGAGPTREVLPRVADEDLRPATLARLLADKVRSAPRKSGRVTNVINGNVTGAVVQAGDIHGGIRF